METTEKKLLRIIALMATLLLTFGITGFDFSNPGPMKNLREYLEIITGAIAGGYWFYLKIKR